MESEKASLVVKRDKNGPLITLPSSLVERKQRMRAQLPGDLAQLLSIYDERQIFLIINELETGTTQILLEEDISPVSWLVETHRSKKKLSSLSGDRNW